SHLEYFYKRPRIPKSILTKYREGLIVGSACEAGEVFRGITGGASEEELSRLVDFYDYLEVQPLANNQFMINKGMAGGEEDLKAFNKKIIALAKEKGKPVVATCDAHYTSPEEAIYRNILMAGQGFSDDGGGGGLYLRTTEEMLEEFSYLDRQTAEEIVIEGPEKIAQMIQDIRPVPVGKFPPKIPDSENILRDTCEKNAAEKYGSPLPEKIRARLDKELDSIIGNGYAVMYVSAKMLVDKSMSDGFLVGSRGSVGSSFAATMSGITEVNPLAPHYICPQCKYLEWGDEQEYDCGVDMPEKACPQCGSKLDQDGFSIPFETFLGFEGDKEPDIDLNFAGEYQGTAHKYVDEIFGAKNVYKAGTIGTIASKTAYGFVMKYFENKGQPVNKYELDRLTEKCTGVKRTTGQHPGGIIIVPDDHEIYEFCPVQRPANDTKTDIITTHFDYHSIDSNLLKLDILGHDVPSMIKHLQDMTGVDPQKVPLKDERVTGIFNGIEGLDIQDPEYKFTHGSYGIPEFGTKFVRQMLDDTKPDKFADLVRISGFSHGTNVWLNNAQAFIRSGEATMREAISTRDDIMNYLILKGLPNKEAFNIMEKVRKGKGVTEEREELMRQNDVPEWYIESCKRISYMFPRAHAVAYVMMSYRIAYYKVYHPAAFYAVYLTTKIADFNWEVIRKGSKAVLERMEEIELKEKNATKKEEDEVTVLEIAYELYSRGYQFMDPDLSYSKAMNFTVKDGKVVVPLCGLNGVGETVGKAIEAEQKNRPFETVEDLQSRAKVNKTAIESLRQSGVLEGMPESDQLCMF
ncbi:MAG: PolC-type DNA polymerase III, partial [Anaerovoracaceae bacterium]